MAELTALHTLTAQMKREGIRRLLVLSGKSVGVLIMRLSCVMPYTATGCGFRRSQMLKPLFSLGTTNFTWARVPACGIRRPPSFDAAAFAALSGTLKAGSWLVLLPLYGMSGKPT